MADPDVEDRVSHLEERMYNVDFTIKEIGENTRQSLSDMRQEMYRALDGMSNELREFRQEMRQELRELRTHMYGLIVFAVALLSLVAYLTR